MEEIGASLLQKAIFPVKGTIKYKTERCKVRRREDLKI